MFSEYPAILDLIYTVSIVQEIGILLLYLRNVGVYFYPSMVFFALLSAICSFFCLLGISIFLFRCRITYTGNKHASTEAPQKDKKNKKDGYHWLKIALFVTSIVVLSSCVVVFLASFNTSNDLSMTRYIGDVSFDKRLSEIQIDDIDTSKSLAESESSHYSADDFSFNYIHVLLDDEYPWIEGAKSDGKGQWIKLWFTKPKTIQVIGLYLGYGAPLFEERGRPTALKFEFSDGASVEYDDFTKDNDMQFVQLSHPVRTNWIKITIVDAVQGDKGNRQVCIRRVKLYQLADRLNLQ